MAGIRIVHDTLRNGWLVVHHPTKKYVVPYICPRCKETHLNKAIHIWLDHQGTSIVSEEVHELLRQSGMPGLTFSNVVVNPPPQYVGPGATTSKEERLKEDAPMHHTKYDGQLPRVYELINKLFVPKGAKKNG